MGGAPFLTCSFCRRKLLTNEGGVLPSFDGHFGIHLSIDVSGVIEKFNVHVVLNLFISLG